MTPQIVNKLAGYWLRHASHEYGNHGCNDLPREVMDLFSENDQNGFAAAYNVWNGHEDPEEDTTFRHMGDSSQMAFLAYLLDGKRR